MPPTKNIGGADTDIETVKLPERLNSGPIREHFLPPFPFPDPPPIPIPVVPPMPQGQGDAYVHVSSTLVDDMTEVLRETRLAQLTAVDQQHALVAYMCGLNEWLARDAHDRRVEVGGVLARMEDLTDWVREMRRDAFTSETDFESEEASTEGSEVPVHYPDMNDDYAQSGRRDPQRVYRTRNGYALYYSR